MTLTTTTAEQVYDWLGRALTSQDADGVLADLVDTATLGLADVELVVRAADGRPGWAGVLDPDTCPAGLLPWLAQWVGVRLDDRLSVGEQRTQIKTRAYHRRGTVPAILAAARAWLSSGDVVLTERDGSAYQLTVTYDAAQVEALLTYADLAAAQPTYADVATAFKRYGEFDGNESELQAAVLAAKPVGLVVTFVKNP